MSIRAISYGGGVQSTALLVLAAQGRIDYRLAIMANVGDDSEHPATLEYVRDIAAPYAEANGIELHVLNRHKRDGSVETLWGRIMREGGRSMAIPVRLNRGQPARRSCTADFKTRVTGKFLKQMGATADAPATVALGISLDEIHRANAKRTEDHERVVYPLIGIGDETGLKMTRADCMALIASAGLPVPPKSSCFFCPFHRPSTWQDMARDEPELFEKAARLEDRLIKMQTDVGKGPVFLTDAMIPLREAFAGTEDQRLLPGLGDCDGGWCNT